ncbi:hypothetical protein Tco_0183299 [Tanacetum coccineum]
MEGDGVRDSRVVMMLLVDRWVSDDGNDVGGVRMVAMVLWFVMKGGGRWPESGRSGAGNGMCVCVGGLGAVRYDSLLFILSIRIFFNSNYVSVAAASYEDCGWEDSLFRTACSSDSLIMRWISGGAKSDISCGKI